MAGIVISVVVVLSAACAGSFLKWDDQQTVAANPFVRSFSYFWAHPHMDLYVPVTYDVWAALAAAGAEQPSGALAPGPFHVANVVVHVLATLMVYGIIRRLLHLGAWPAALGAVLFGSHPIQVEAVAWVSGMKDVLYAMLCLAALWVDPLAGEAPSPHGSPPSKYLGSGLARYVVATALFAVAVLAKPTAMMLPAIVLTLAWARGRLSSAAVVRMAPWLAISLACAIWTQCVQSAALEPAPLWLRPLVAGHALGTYLWKLLVPVKLAVDYGYSPQWLKGHPIAQIVALVPLVLAIVVAVVCWRLRPRARVLATGAIVFVLGLLPVLGLVPFDFQFYSTVADHYVYLPMLGVALAAAWGASKLKPQARVLVTAALLVGLGVRSFVQAGYWLDDRTLFTRTLEVNPRSVAALSQLASMALDQSRPDDAEVLAKRALEVRPDYPTAWVGLASSYSMRGRAAEAFDAYRSALAISPNNPEVLVNFGIAMAQAGQLDEAERLLKRAIEQAPTDSKAHMNLGTVYNFKARPDLARREYEAAIRWNPTDAAAHTNLGFILMSLGLTEEARREFTAALRVQPGFADAQRALWELGGR
jgi:tetratricopeptide (TPR) repeat protein